VAAGEWQSALLLAVAAAKFDTLRNMGQQAMPQGADAGAHQGGRCTTGRCMREACRSKTSSLKNATV
jgi:hypothetical protein